MRWRRIKCRKLSLSNNAIWDALGAVRGLAPKLAVFGGGGYNPYALARCWAGIWAILNDLPLPDVLAGIGRGMMLRGVPAFPASGGGCPAVAAADLRDAPITGVVRDVVKRMGDV